MALFTLREIIEILITVVVVGFVMSGFIRRPRRFVEIAEIRKFSFEDISYAIMIAAPAVILHELGHKFSAIYFGASAHFQIFYFGLGLAIILRLVNSPLLFLAPGAVFISGGLSGLSNAIVAFSGPAVNLILYFISDLMMKSRGRHVHTDRRYFFAVSRQLNLWLFIFNMIPIPPLDGFHVLSGLLGLF